MKRKLLTAFTALFTLSVATSLHAGSLSGYVGYMDTDLLGKGEIVGGMLEFDPLPLTAIQLRVSYASSFENLSFEHINEGYLGGGFNSIGSILDETLELDEFCIVPLEIGVVGRLSLFGFLGVYGGGGAGYYVIPAFEFANSKHFSLSEDISDSAGWWVVAGIEAGLPSLNVFAEIKYTDIFLDDYNIDIEYYGYKGHITADINLSGFTCLMGVRLKW